jgi:hypothetical protein
MTKREKNFKIVVLAILTAGIVYVVSCQRREKLTETSNSNSGTKAFDITDISDWRSQLAIGSIVGVVLLIGYVFATRNY